MTIFSCSKNVFNPSQASKESQWFSQAYVHNLSRLNELHQTYLHKKAPRFYFEIRKGDYLIKTANQWTEILGALDLRHEVFHKEKLKRELPLGLDIDEMDFLCDQLVIKQITTGRICGVYRLALSQFTEQFYASERFYLGEFLKMPGLKLELGRACVKEEHRNGTVLQLLWRGIFQYAQESKIDYLFGSSSILCEESSAAAQFYSQLESRGYTSEKYPIGVLKAFEGFEEHLKNYRENPQEGKQKLTPLMLSYLRAGAVIAAHPAQDSYMQSADFLTILDRNGMKAYGQKYL